MVDWGYSYNDAGDMFAIGGKTSNPNYHNRYDCSGKSEGAVIMRYDSKTAKAPSHLRVVCEVTLESDGSVVETVGVRAIRVVEDNYSVYKVFGVFEVTGTYSTSFVMFKIGDYTSS